MENINIVKGDITTIPVDAIVNAANAQLQGGGGVDGAIHRAGGPAIMEECREIGACPTGEAVATNAGNLPAKYVIHTVGPIWGKEHGREEKLLESAYQNSLWLAKEKGLKSISFPNISTGVYGFPKDLAADIALKAAHDFLKNHQIEINFVCYDEENYQLYKKKLGDTNKE